MNGVRSVICSKINTAIIIYLRNEINNIKENAWCKYWLVRVAIEVVLIIILIKACPKMAGIIEML